MNDAIKKGPRISCSSNQQNRKTTVQENEIGINLLLENSPKTELPHRDRPPIGSFMKRYKNQHDKKPKEKRIKKSVGISEDLLGRNEEDLSRSLIDSCSSSGKSMNVFSKSYIVGKWKGRDSAERNQSDAEQEELSKTKIQSKRKRSLLPKRNMDNSGFVQTRDVSPFNFKQLQINGKKQNKELNNSGIDCASPSFQSVFTKNAKDDFPDRCLLAEHQNRQKQIEDLANYTENVVYEALAPRITSNLGKRMQNNSECKNELLNKSSYVIKSTSSEVVPIIKQSLISYPRRNEESAWNLNSAEIKQKSTLDNKIPISIFVKSKNLANNETEPQIIQIENDICLKKNMLEIQENRLKKVYLMNEEIIELNFSDRKINDSSLQLIIPEILKNKKARILNLSNNFITDIGVETIVKKLFLHPTLEMVNLKGNFVEERVFDVLKLNAKSLKKLNQFCFSDNKPMRDRVKIRSAILELRKANIRVDV